MNRHDLTAQPRQAADQVRSAAQRTPTQNPIPIGVVVPGLVILGLIVVLGPALVGRGVLLDVNSLSARLPFRAWTGLVNQDTITCRQDTIDYFPAIAEIRQSVFSGNVPTWAPYEVGGAPLASQPNFSFLTPLALPYFLAPLWLAPALVKLLEIIVALVGTIAFLRRRGVSPAGAWLAGFVFALSGFMIAWSNWPHTRVAALIPLLMWATDKVIDQHRARDVVILAFVFAAMLLGGFPAVTLYSLVVAGVYALVRVWAQYRQRLQEAIGALALAVAGLVLGFGLAAVQMIPFMLNLSATLSNRDKGGGHLPLSTAVTLLDPAARGVCRGGVWFGSIIPIEAICYVGAGAIVLAVLGIGFRRQRAEEPGTRLWLLGSLAVAAILIWVGGPLLALYARLPVLGNNSITRAQSVVGFLMACLAGLGFDRLMRRSHGELRPLNGIGSGAEKEGNEDGPVHPRSKRPLVTVLAAVLIVLLVIGAAVWDARRGGYLGHLAGSLVIPILLLLAATAVVVLVYRGPSRLARWGPVSVVALVVVQSTLFAQSMLPLSQRDLLYPTTPTHQFLQANIGHSRYGAGDRTMDSSISDWYHLPTPTGHDITDARWSDVLDGIDPEVQRTNTYSAFPPSLPFDDIARSPILDRLAVRYWTADPRRRVGNLAEPLSKNGRIRLAGDQPATCRVEGGPLWGISLYLAEEMPVVAPGATPILHVHVTSGGETRSGSVLLDGRNLGPGRIQVAVAGEDLPRDRRAEVRVSLTGTDQPRYFAGKDRRLSCSAAQPDSDTDGVRLVFADAGSAIYERLSALPRIRWASRSRVVDPERQVAALRTGVPDDTVLLDDGSTMPAQGGTGTVSVTADDAERIAVDTASTRQGYLVVADSIARPGWSATVDGEPTPLVAADHAFAAVPVPAGRHRVELTYTAPGLRDGAIVSVLSLLVTAALVLSASLLRRGERWRLERRERRSVRRPQPQEREQ